MFFKFGGVGAVLSFTVEMLRSTSLERLAVEIYLPADIVRDLDDNRYFDEHPRYKETPLQPTAPPFCPVRFVQKNQVLSAMLDSEEQTIA